MSGNELNLAIASLLIFGDSQTEDSSCKSSVSAESEINRQGSRDKQEGSTEGFALQLRPCQYLR